MQQPAPRGGRPRPAATIERDNRIHTLLTQGARSRGQIAQATGLTTDLVHLALRRLQKDGRVRQCLHEGVIVWSVDDGTPCP
ncbi:MAG UNVERIFIED_CONTAM: winged helix-turn-helix domain-containing protein [Thermobifida fusca]